VIGQTIGSYRITAKLGEGGMGEVYRGHDPRLSRDVAIKFSKEQFTDRFQREARAVAALGHPNICRLYDVGPNYLVLEYIEGESPRGPMALDDALKIARQIADALEAAHEKGIVHRDLKPANIKIKPDGTVVILDFGLATAASAPGADPSESPTMLSTPTHAGMILGTAAYMSPEQARGKLVDKRADIWAFGVVLYELIAGKQLFTGETVSDVIAGVLKGEPDLSIIPPKARRLVESCLQRDPKQRLRDIGDASKLLIDPPAATSAGARQAGRRWLTSLAVAVVLMLGISGVLVWRISHLRSTGPTGPIAFTVDAAIPADLGDALLAGSGFPAVSPDGEHLAYTAPDSAGKSALHVRSLNSFESRTLEGTDGARSLFWSPDSREVAFFTQDKLMRASIAGGHPRIISDLGPILYPRGGAWNSEGVILVGDIQGIVRVSASGGVPERWIGFDHEGAAGWPQFLPGGHRFLYWANPERKRGGVYAGSLDSKQTTLLFPSETNAAFVEPGKLLFEQQGSLLAQSFDLSTLKLSGEAVRVAGDVHYSGSRAAFSVSNRDVLAFQTGEFDLSSLIWYTRDGKRDRTLASGERIHQISLSPDGKRVSVERYRDPSAGVVADIWMAEISTGVMSRMSVSGDAHDAAWSPDSRRIAFELIGKEEIRDVPVGGSEALVYSDGKQNRIDTWTPDGKAIIYRSNGGRDVYILPMDGSGKPHLIWTDPFTKDEIHISPDGRWAAYDSGENGRQEIYVTRFPSFADKRQVSASGGVQPLWRSDGRELFYFSPDGNLMGLEIKSNAAAEGLETGVARALFHTTVPLTSNTHHYAVAPGGQRFLLEEPVTKPGSSEVKILVNWQQGLK
jgi:eukaryotic-like serine/threonine-protein kinase